MAEAEKMRAEESIKQNVSLEEHWAQKLENY